MIDSISGIGHSQSFDDHLRHRTGWTWVVCVILIPLAYVIATSSVHGTATPASTVLWMLTLATVAGMCYRTSVRQWGTGGVFVVVLLLPLVVFACLLAALMFVPDSTPLGAGGILILPLVVAVAALIGPAMQLIFWRLRSPGRTDHGG